MKHYPVITRISQAWKRFTRHEKTLLGRWNIDNCDTKINQKIDLSNEDHCGPCGQYIMDKQLTKVIITKIKNENENEKNKTPIA